MLVQDLLGRMRRLGITFASIERRSGLNASTMKRWRNHEPRLGNFVAVVESMGGKVVVVWDEDKTA
jgi:lambda repressor-like predicted transcriptional regulator